MLKNIKGLDQKKIMMNSMLNSARGMYQAGFTIIELMVTLAVLSIIISLAAPSFVSMLNNNLVTGATNDLIASFQLARTEAIKRNGTVDIRSKNGSDWSNGYRVQVNSSAQILRDVDALHSKVSLTSFPSTVTFVSYVASGAVETAATFRIDTEIIDTGTSNCESGVSRKVRDLQLGLSGSTSLTTRMVTCP